MQEFPAIPQDIIELRRDLHLHPELSCKEERTSAIVANKLERLGYKVIADRSKGYSLLGIMEFALPGRTLALRADMDALPIVENKCNLLREKTYVSRNDGVAHMCGHDFHTAGMLAAARAVTELKEKLCGRIIFCFESGEEIGRGEDARELLSKQGAVDSLFGIHIHANYPVGTVAVSDGACTAGCETFHTVIRGRSVHGATPHLGIDPINCAAQITLAANSIISRRINSRESAVLSICSINSGTAWNRFPDDATISGGSRFFSEDVGHSIHDYFEQLVHGTASANGCTAEISWSNWCSPVTNDPGLAAAARMAASSIGAEIVPCEPWMASETFARYRPICPEVLAFVGCANTETGCGAPQHSDLFDADENCLAVSAAMTLSFIKDFLS